MERFIRINLLVTCFIICMQTPSGLSGPIIPRICPEIISKVRWGAHIPLEINYALIPVENVIIHHTATSGCSTESECASLLISMQNYHMEVLELHDIKYNFLVGGDGQIYEGAGWHKIGAHTKGYNSRSLCLAFIGNFKSELPSPKAIEAAKDFFQCGVELRELDKNYKLFGARQVKSTESPGLKLYRKLQNWPHFTRNPPNYLNLTRITPPEICPEIITRAGWNAKNPTEVNYSPSIWKNIIIHHTETPKCGTFDECRTRVKNIQSYHIDQRKFPDIAYNFLIGGDGRIYEGTGWYRIGSHTKGYNSLALGVAFIGGFNTSLPNEKQIQAAKGLFHCGIEMERLDTEYKLYGASQVRATDSPGLKLYQEIQNWPHFSRNPPK